MRPWPPRPEDPACSPIIAGLVHYQFVTIHPYYDSNGRTARLLATFILHKGGYGLNGFFSLEEHHARDLPGYYRALTLHPHHNYYFGRGEADLSPWLEYFISTLAVVFEAVRLTAQKCAIGQGWCSASLPQRIPLLLPRWPPSWASPSAWPETFQGLG